MPVVAFRVMIVIKNRGHLLTCTNEGEPVPNTFGMAIVALNLPQYDLVEIPSFVGPLSPCDQFGRRHLEPLYVASYTMYFYQSTGNGSLLGGGAVV